MLLCKELRFSSAAGDNIPAVPVAETREENLTRTILSHVSAWVPSSCCSGRCFEYLLAHILRCFCNVTDGVLFACVWWLIWCVRVLFPGAIRSWGDSIKRPQEVERMSVCITGSWWRITTGPATVSNWCPLCLIICRIAAINAAIRKNWR